MKKLQIITILLLGVLLISCKGSGRVLPSATGARFELLVVMDNPDWNGTVGRKLYNLLDKDMDALPQPEPMFRISQVNHLNFTDILRPSRNILYVDISPERYTQGKVTFSKNYFAYPQAFVRLAAPDEESLMRAIDDQGENILNYFVVSERERTMHFHKQDLNKEAVKEVRDMFGIEVDIPVELKRATKSDDFYWITNDNGYIRQDLIIYSYPYTDSNTFTYEFLTAKRDSVVKYNIPGEFEGSYMGTEYKYARPAMKEMAVNGEYAVEMKGLWKILNGGSMGGPYYSLTRLDEVNQRVVTVEGFVFAPAANKRNPIRMLEAVVHSMRLPQDVNRLDEVQVVPEQNNDNQ